MKKVQSPQAPAAIGPYSQAIIQGDLVFTSGQIALDPASGEMTGKTAAEQAEQVCRNLRAVLEEAGSSLDRVIKTTCFLADMGDFAAFNEVYGRHFSGKPARSTVAVKELPRKALVEIEAVAAI
jgi:2-iminobutanoate/2-iminopropanoate deaminase